MVFSTVESSITKSGQALGIFKKDWHDVIYDIQNTSGIANKFKAAFSNTISSTDLDAIKKYNTEIKNGVTSQMAFNRCMLKTSSAARNLVASANGATVSEETLTVATKRLTLAQKAGIAISKAFGTALNIALNVGVTLAISAIITGITKLVNAQQEAKEKIEEQARSAKQLSDDLFDLRKQYITLSKEVETDKSKKEQLTSVTEELLKKLGYEKEAVGDLVDEYGNLDNAINGVSLTALEEAGNALRVEYGNKKSALAKDKNIFDDIFNSGNGRLYSFLIPSGKTINSDVAKALNDSGIFNKNTSFGIDSGKIYLNGSIFSVDEMKQNYQDISDALSLLNSKFELDVIKDDSIYKALQSKQDELKKVIDEYNSSINNLNNNLAQQEILKGLQGKELPKTKEDFDEFVESVVNASIASEQFIGSEKDIRNSIMAFLETMPEFSSFFVVEQKNVGDTTKLFSDLKEETKSLQETLDSTFSNQSTLQSAFDKIQEGTSLSADEVRKLIELCPQLATEFVKTADGYTVGADKLIEANDSIVESAKQSLQERANYLREFINNDYDTSTISGETSAKAHNEWKQSVEKAKTELKGLDLILSMFGLTANDTVDKVKELSDKYDELSDSTSKLVGKAKTLSSAFAEQNENGSLSTETVLSLIENGYAAALMYDKTTGAIRLNADAYIALATAEIEAQIADLETQKAIAETSAIEAKKSIVSNLGWSYLGAAQSALELARAESIVNNAEADVSNYDAKIKALEEYKNHLNDITNGTYGGSGSGSNTDSNKEAFDTANNLRKHWLAMGKDNTGKKYTEEMYYAWLDSANGYKKYFSDLTKYTDEYRQYEEEIYKWRINKDKELFEERIENYEKLKDKELNDSEYDNPIKKYEEAGKIINQEMSAIQSRIQELVESGSSAVQDEIDSLKEKYDSLKEEQEEIQKDIWDTRVENEKTFWESQKEAVENDYDNEIKKLEEIEDEQERINKKEELRLNLIKAQQELLDAKKNRNQLLFANGGFYYDYDQETVQKAQENITNAEQDITDFNNDETKRLLEEQRDNEIAYYNIIIKMLEAYINKTLPIETSDSEVFNTAMSSKYAQSALNKQTEITSVTLKSFLQDRFPNYNKQALDSGYDLLGKIMNKPISSTLNAWDNLKKMNAQNYTVNNNNNNSVYIENMPITVPVGTTEEQVQSMIDQFASGVISTVRAKRAKLQ